MVTIRIFRYALPLLILLLIPGTTVALTADEIIKKASLVYNYAGDDGVARLKMRIKDRRGRERYREMTMLRKDIEDGGRQYYYVYFHRPADVEKMVFMVWKNIGKDDDRWLYIPAIDLVRRIAARDKRSSFAGSHFTYEDVSGRNPEDDEHTIMKDELLDGRPVYIIKNVPKDKDIVEFSYYVTWIDKGDFLPRKAEYFDKARRLYKVFTVEKIETIQGIPTVVKIRAEDKGRGGETVVEFEDIRYDVGIKKSVFHERYLRRPPRQWIR